MNEMQKIYDFVMSKVTDEHKTEASNLLNEAIDKHKNGGLNIMYLTTFIPKVLGFVGDAKDEVMKVLEEFKNSL